MAPDERRSFAKTTWTGNGWAAFDIEPYWIDDFEPVLRVIVAALKIPFPEVLFMPDGYAADFVTDGVCCSVNLDAWSFSIASESEEVRDRLIDVVRTGMGWDGAGSIR